MAEHYIHKCSCGKVISQCRCMGHDKSVHVTQDGCIECQARKAQGTPAVAPNPNAYKNTNLGVPVKDQKKALEFSKKII